jgi:hypothetical protein
METMETTNILLKSPMPRNRHREEKRVETGVVETFSDIAARRDDYPWTVLCLGEFLGHSGTLLRAHSALQNKNSINVLTNPCVKALYMISPPG